MLIPSNDSLKRSGRSSLSRRVNANSQLDLKVTPYFNKLIKKGECSFPALVDEHACGLQAYQEG